ncbi:MAG: MaoC family dehydratase [Pseudomonadota bacterium]
MIFNDFAAGQVFETDTKTITEEAIIAFANEYDWQYFHTDAEAAERSHFGGLIASGFHTLLTAFGLTLASRTWSEASMGSPGIEEVRWLAPVRPGDALTVRIEVADTKPSRSKPDRGIVTFDHAVSRQDGTVVMTYRSKVIIGRKPNG